MNLYTSNHELITDRKVRIGLAGCGRISKNHISAMQAHSERVELTSVCDLDADALAAAVKETGATGYRSLPEMLAGDPVDMVVLCTPSGLHPMQAQLVAESGTHVMTEKPMATNWQDGKSMVDACDAAGVHLFVVKQNRLNPTLQMLKKAVEEGRFGKINMVNVNVFWTRPQEYYDSAAWRGTWEYDGGAFMNQASHYIDMVDWLVGPIESLHAYTATLGRRIEVEDSGVISFKSRAGTMGSINVTMLTYPKNLEGSVTILGEKGTVRLGGVAVNEIQHWEFEDSREEDKGILDANYQTTSVYGNGHPLFYDNVLSVLTTGSEPITDGREGLKSLEVLIAAYLSARDGRRVSLPLDY